MRSRTMAYSATEPKAERRRPVTGLSAGALERCVADYFTDFAWDPQTVEPAAMSAATFFQFLTRE